jgi:hypothetical protein
MSSLGRKKLFLDQLFWSEDAFKYIGNKLKNIFPTIGFENIL